MLRLDYPPKDYIAIASISVRDDLSMIIENLCFLFIDLSYLSFKSTCAQHLSTPKATARVVVSGWIPT